MQVSNALAIRLSIPSTSNQDFPAFDSPTAPVKGEHNHSLREQLLRYAQNFEDCDFDLRDRNKSDDDSINLVVNLSRHHNLTRINQNPAAAAQYFQIAFDAIVSTLFGVHASDGKTDMLPIHHDQRRGIFGRVTNFDANLEANQRQALHFHGLVTGTLSPALLGAIAHSPVLMESVSAAFDSMVLAHIAPDRMLEHIVSDRFKTKLHRPDFASAIPPDSISAIDKQAHAAAASTKTVMHFRNHCDACVRCGRHCCRFAKPSGLVECTGMRMVALQEQYADHPDPRTEHFDVRIPVERPKHNYNRDPIEPLDSRALSFEIRRPAIPVPKTTDDSGIDDSFDIRECLDDPMFDDVDQGIKAKILSLSDDEAQIITDHLFNANGLVSEFNSILMCVANCNMALYPMGTASSAKAQFMYTCKYVTKCPTEIMSLLSILYNAAKHIEKHPSTAEDSGTVERTTRHFLQRVLNKLCGRQEYGANMVVAALIGQTAEFQMHKTSQIYADAALRYVAETNNPANPDAPSHSNDDCDDTARQDTDQSSSDSQGSESSDSDEVQRASSQRPVLAPVRDVPLLDLLASTMTEVEEFGPLVDESTEADQSPSTPVDTAEQQPACDVNIREHEPSDSFEDLLDSNQTHVGTVSISFDDNGTPRTSLQHQDYHYRPEKCAQYSLFEFAQSMRCVDKRKATPQIEGRNPKNAGRKATARLEFKDGHPLKSTHDCQIMLQHTVPNIVRRTPRYPGPRPDTLTSAWKSAARLFAYHIMLLYKPWEGPNGIPPPEALTWKAMHVWLNQLRAAPPDDIVCRTRLQFVTIAAHGLKICAEPSKLINKYRHRNATRLDEMDEEDKPRACSRPKLDDARVKANHTAEMGELAINALLEKASSAFDEKSVQMQESTVDFLTKAFPVSAALSSPLTSASTRQQCLDLVCAGTFEPKQVRKVHDNIMLKPSDVASAQDSAAAAIPHTSPSGRRKRRSKPSRSVPPPDQFQNFLWSEQQLQIIHKFESYCKAVAAWRTSPSPLPQNLPAPPHMLIQGGPGSGKSAVTRKLTKLAKQYALSSISSAMTAVAALNMDGASTNHSAYHIAVDRRSKSNKRPRNANLANMSQSQRKIFASKLRLAIADGTPVITFLDEVSLTTAITLGHMLQRYHEIDNLIIGPFILVGDFFQVYFAFNNSQFFIVISSQVFFSDQASGRCHHIQFYDAV